MNAVIQKLDRHFELEKLRSDWRVEIFAGLSTFLSLSYIFVVNPAILSEAGMSKSAVFFATVIVSSLATIMMGLWANKPFSLAPGLETNAYVAFIVIGTYGFGWQDALGAVFWSGVLMLAINFLRIRAYIIEAIPDELKSGLAASVGVFLVLISLKISGILLYEDSGIKGPGQLVSPEVGVFFVGLISVFLLRYFMVRGAVLISISISSVVAHLLNTGNVNEKIELSKEVIDSALSLNIGIIFEPEMLGVILVLFVIDFYGSISKFIGLARDTTIMDSNGNMPKMKEALTIDGGATVLGAALGTTNVTTYVESAVGISEGGRTGLTSVVSGTLMLLLLFLAPLVNLVPVIATTGSLFFIGLTLLPTREELKKYYWADIIAIVGMILTTVLTFRLEKAMFVGFLFLVVSRFSFLILKRSGIFRRYSKKGVITEPRKINLYLILSAILLFVSIMLS